MTTLFKNLMAICTLGGLAIAGLLPSASAFAAVTVSCADGTDSDCTSSIMGGRWDQNFGNDEHNCLYLLPSNPTRRVETPIGGIIETDNPVSCLGGLESTNLVNMGSVQVRVFSGTSDTAYSWSWNTDDLASTDVAQFIPAGCSSIGDFDSTTPVNVRNGSFDNGDTPPDGPRPIIEPLSLEFTLDPDVDGNATVSYYFVQGKNDCRSLVWTLKVNGVEKDTGGIADFSLGKYLVFDLTGLEGSEAVLLEVADADDEACDTISPNSIIAGLFISGTSVCTPAFCGDGDVNSPGETCDPPDSSIVPDPSTGPQTCSDECTYCGDMIKNGDEECDPTDTTDPNANKCGDDCTIEPFCGDDIVDTSLGETCDPPGTSVPSTDGGVCREDCTYCGDGATNDGEVCDPTDPAWIESGGCTTKCELEIPTLGCRFTGGLNDVFITENEKKNRYSAGGQVGANTGQQPQPKGEWTHRQRRGPAGKFTFHGGTASAPLGSEIDVIRCSDPGGCKPSGDPPSPVKQLDFDGIGTFKNIGKKNGSVPDFVKAGAMVTAEGNGNKDFDGTLHWFEVNIDDLGEPGNTNPKKNPGDGTEACPVNGFGEKGDEELGDCSCSDFYRITIYDGVDATTVPRNPDGSIDKASMNTEDVIYEVWGYINGGNLQLHHPTGFDLK